MNETLQEFCNSRGVPVRADRTAGVIRGVKILGLKSRNGRTYLPEALDRAAALYENAKVNVNHPKGGPSQPRDYRDRIGAIRNVTSRPGEGLFADFHFNPKHPLAEQLAWDAENSPQNVGFSHNVQARTGRRDGVVVVEAIVGVQSVDLVADPATTDGLFEQETETGGNTAELDPNVAAVLKDLTVEQLKQYRGDLVEEITGPLLAELDELRAKLDELSAEEAARLKRETARRLLREYRLPDRASQSRREPSVVGPRFMESLLAAADERAMRELVEERAELVRSLGGRGHSSADGGFSSAGGNAVPTSREQFDIDRLGAGDAKSFVEAIT